MPIAREIGTIGVEQNKPMRTPGVANVDRSDATARSQPATSWQPAAVAYAIDLGDDGLGCTTQRVHQHRAAAEQLDVVALVAIEHLGDVVPRGERRAVGFDDQYLHRRVGGQFVDGALERLHELEAHRVAPRRTGQSHERDAAVAADFDAVVTHGARLQGPRAALSGGKRWAVRIFRSPRATRRKPRSPARR
jgi:hypothetical protein